MTTKRTDELEAGDTIVTASGALFVLDEVWPPTMPNAHDPTSKLWLLHCGVPDAIRYSPADELHEVIPL